MASIVKRAISPKSSRRVLKVCHYRRCISQVLKLKSSAAAALGLMDFDDSSAQVAYSSLIQTFNRFLLERMGKESDVVKLSLQYETESDVEPLPPASLLSQIIGLNTRTTSTCSSCGHRVSRDSSTNILDFVYPRKVCSAHLAECYVSDAHTKALSNEIPSKNDFASIFKASIARENVTRSICPSCRQTTSARVRRQLTGSALPSVLTVNASIHTPDHMQAWVDPPLQTGQPKRFLSPQIAVSLLGDEVVTVEPGEVPAQGLLTYELCAIVVQIQSAEDPAHLVSLVKGKPRMIERYPRR